MISEKIPAAGGARQTNKVLQNKEIDMEQNFRRVGGKSNKSVRVVRRAMLSTSRTRVVQESVRQITLSKAEAMHLLALCGASPLSLHHSEEALYAKLGNYVRQR